MQATFLNSSQTQQCPVLSCNDLVKGVWVTEQVQKISKLAVVDGVKKTEPFS